MSADPYTDEFGILINLLGVTDTDRLRQAEADLSYAAMLRLAEHPLPGSYDLAHLRGFHRALFGAVYPWAGHVAVSQRHPHRVIRDAGGTPPGRGWPGRRHARCRGRRRAL